MGTDIVTLRLDEASQAHFDRLRKQYFPPERNLIPAHLTLFHTLPSIEDIAAALESEATKHAAFPLIVTGLRSLGRGVAYALASSELLSLHRDLSSTFAGHLTAQDRQKFHPHIVIQNKVSAESARELLALLQASFTPFSAQANGLDLWHYLGGPWQHARTFAFPTGI